jgi:hypothetical protein
MAGKRRVIVESEISSKPVKMTHAAGPCVK